MCSDDEGSYVSSKISNLEVFEVTLSSIFGATLIDTITVLLPEKMKLILKCVLVFFSHEDFPTKSPFFSNESSLKLSYQEWVERKEEKDYPDLYLSYENNTINQPVVPYPNHINFSQKIDERKPVYYFTLKFILRENLSFRESFSISVQQVKIAGRPFIDPNAVIAKDFNQCLNFYENEEDRYLEEPESTENTLLYLKMSNFSESISKMMIFSLKFLEELNLSKIKIRLIDQKSLSLISSFCLNLVKLNLSNLKSLIDDHFLTKLSENCKNLQHISLYNCNSFTSETFSKFIQSFPNLLQLDISFCSQIQKKDLELISKCFNLRSLSVSDLSLLDDKLLLLILENLVHLSELDISFCNSLSTVSVSKIGMRQANLKKLNFHSVKCINDACAFEVKKISFFFFF